MVSILSIGSFAHGTARRTLKGPLPLHVLYTTFFPLPLFMFLLEFLSTLLLLASVKAELNITIDDLDPRIVYQPTDAWSFQGNVRPSPFSRTAHTSTQLHGRPLIRKID